MSEYSICVGKKEYHVQITDTHMLVNNEPVQPDRLQTLGDGRLHLLRKKQGAFALQMFSHDESTYEAQVHGQRRRVWIEPKRRANQTKGKNENNANEIKANMPGLVVDVLVNHKDNVEEGQVLVVMESMKMQMHLRSAAGGTVQRVAVKPGQQVKKGDMLVCVAPALS